jgi:manganese/zinc/iron transport system substrate-binding protein
VKRKLGILLALFCSLVGGCSRVEKETPPSKKLMKVLSTTAMIDDVVLRVGGDRIDHSVLIVGEIDPHSYELVKGDDEKIDEADLVFFNGLNLEHGASLRYKISSHASSIGLGDYILDTYPNEVLFEQNQADPHIWMDVSLWSYTIDPILKALISKDPEGEEYYVERAHKAFSEMIQFHENLRKTLQSIPENKRYLVTSHDAFAYFTRAYLSTPEEKLLGTWRKRVAAPEGFAPDGQLGAADLRKIVEYLVEYNVQVVFPESNVSPDSLRKIVLACKEKGMNIHFSPESLYGDSMGPKGTDSGTYLGMMKYDADVLIKEWK